jgi:CheY-like chemotaxis protein
MEGTAPGGARGERGLHDGSASAARDTGPGGALLVEASPIGRQLLGLLLRGRFARLLEAEDCAQARAILAAQGPFDVVLVDLDAPGDPEGLVEALHALASPPAIVVATRSPDLQRETRLSLLGVVGHLTKPIGASALFRALRGLDRPGAAVAPPRATSASGEVWAEALDPASGASVVRWEVRDIGPGGALLLTHAALALGERLRLRIRLPGHQLDVDAEVVRVQEPAWTVLPGAAVRFLDLDAASARAIERLCEPAAAGGPERA